MKEFSFKTIPGGNAPQKAEVKASNKANSAVNAASAVPPIIERKGAKGLSRIDWESVLTLHEFTGKPLELAQRARLHVEDVKYLINKGIPRLQLPPVKDHIVDRHQVELALQEQRHQSHPQHQAAVEAATERVISEAAAAQDLLSSAVTTGVIVGSYIEQLAKGLVSGAVSFAVPEELTPGILEILTKVSDANSRTMERAVKLVRLTKGMATDRIEGRNVDH